MASMTQYRWLAVAAVFASSAAFAQTPSPSPTPSIDSVPEKIAPGAKPTEPTKNLSQNLDQYTLLRHSRAPIIEVHLFNSPDAPVGGSGEPPMPTVAPALCNAIYAATKKRVRALPIKNQGFDV